MIQQKKDHEYLQSVPQPVAAFARRYPAGYSGYPHSHARAQFLYADSGSMRPTFNLGTFSTIEKAKQHEREIQYFKKH